MKHVIEVVNSEGVVSFQEHDLSYEQVEYIKDQLMLSRKVPLYSTTKAKAKYGDCIIGNIKSIK